MQRILVPGVGGQVAFPLAAALARDGHEVWGLARLRKPEERARLEAKGIRPFAADLAEPVFHGLPRDFDQVLNFAVAKSGKWSRDLAANAEGLGLLMAHCRESGALLHCSSTAVYAPAGAAPRSEDDALGDHHRALLPTYSICKIAAEAVARSAARSLGIPTTIARLNVPYGDRGGWPAIHLAQILAGQPIAVTADGPHVYNPIHDDDLAAMLPKLVAAASVPATTVNWGGSEAVSLEAWCAFLAEQVGREAKFAVTPFAIPGACIDPSRMHALAGRTNVSWRDGMRRMVDARAA
ncbi:MAG: oxidoreductase [Proteobacteria bacterium]|nr:MAG: oxidoreductase [Pseudomonadota bacterium]